MRVNIHVPDSSCVTLKFKVTDNLWDLRLAFWETQIQEVYPTARVYTQCDHVHNQAIMQIQFDNPEDVCHWHLCNSPYHILTDVNHMLSYVHETQI